MTTRSALVNHFARVGSGIANRLGEQFFTAHPTDGLELMQTEFRQSWLRELGQLTDLCERQMRMDLSWARVAASQLNPARRWSPAAYSPIAQLRMAIVNDDVTAVMDSLARLRNLTNSVAYDTQTRIESILTEDWEWDFVKTMRAYEPRDENGEKALVLPILGMDLAPYREAIAEAIYLIEAVAPAIHTEYAELVSRIKLFQGRVLRGETNTRVYGAVFLRLPPPAYRQVVYWIEHLVHEIAHLRLELLRVHDPLVTNDLVPRYEAPFRRDPRPMLGVLHATFVAARMMTVLRALAGAYPNTIYNARLSSIAAKFDVGMVSLRGAGEFTALGRRVVDSLPAVAYG